MKSDNDLISTFLEDGDFFIGVVNRLILLWKRSHIRPLWGLGFSTKSLLSSGAYGATFFQRKKAILATPFPSRTVILSRMGGKRHFVPAVRNVPFF